MSSRRFFIGGNWKCNGGSERVSSLLSGYAKFESVKSIDIVAAPSFIYLSKAVDALSGKCDVAAQNCGLQDGAFTGEISPGMLVDAGVPWVILGHSERRHKFGETDELIGEKVTKAQEAGLKVIACIGETLGQREAGETKDVCVAQLQAIAEKVVDWNATVIAYEPVWAIGTGKTASPEQAQSVHKMLRQYISEVYSPDVANKVRIIYGGSVKPANAAALGSEPDIDGYLVGGCSLKLDDFNEIVEAGKAAAPVE